MLGMLPFTVSFEWVGWTWGAIVVSTVLWIGLGFILSILYTALIEWAGVSHTWVGLYDRWWYKLDNNRFASWIEGVLGAEIYGLLLVALIGIAMPVTLLWLVAAILVELGHLWESFF